MKHVVLLLAALSVAGIASARSGGGYSGSHSVSGYVKKDGTYVAPHNSTNPNDTKLDNYSTKGNVNPYTGKPGTVDPTAPAPCGINQVRC